MRRLDLSSNDGRGHDVGVRLAVLGRHGCDRLRLVGCPIWDTHTIIWCPFWDSHIPVHLTLARPGGRRDGPEAQPLLPQRLVQVGAEQRPPEPPKSMPRFMAA
jgi:hypothetical protein